MKGEETVCPIGSSMDGPELDLPIWIASPEITVKNLIHTRLIPAEHFALHTRVICLPGITITIRDELQALENIGGKKALELVNFKDDPLNRRIVSSWPSRFDNSYALHLGYYIDEGGIKGIVSDFKTKLDAGLV